MACNFPLRAYQRADGTLKFFTKTQKEYHAKDYSGLQVPCGQCMECRLTHARHWATRMHHEAQLHKYNCFATLTYNNDTLPHDLSIDPTHLQKFFKRLRWEYGELRYYACGEYGEKTQRPHYHACIFGMDFHDKQPFKKLSTYQLYTSHTLDRIWGYGTCVIGDLTYETAQYTAKYVTKKVLRGGGIYMRMDDETGELFPVVQPRAFMSLRPAIGNEWVQKYSTDLLKDHVVVRCRKTNLPKYYDRLMEKLHTAKHTENKQKRITNAKKLTNDELHAREKITRAKLKKREIHI